MDNKEAIYRLEKLKTYNPFTSISGVTLLDKELITLCISALEKQDEWPKKGDTYWYLYDNGEALSAIWDLTPAHVYRNFLGIFRTEAEAIARRDAIREFVKELK